MQEGKLHSVFKVYRNVKISENFYEWHNQLCFYEGDLSNVNLSTDFRFKEVSGKRNLAELLGTCTVTFPISFPLTLDNGIVVNSGDHYQEK